MLAPHLPSVLTSDIRHGYGLQILRVQRELLHLLMEGISRLSLETRK